MWNSIRSIVLVASMQALALSSTVIRIVDRCRARRMWWDEYLAILMLVTDSLLIAVYPRVSKYGCERFRAFLSSYILNNAVNNLTCIL